MTQNNNSDFRIFLVISLVIHLIIAILLIFGMPSLFRKLPEEQIISFEIVTVSDKTNIKTQKVQKEKAIEEDKAKTVKKSTPESSKSEPTYTEEPIKQETVSHPEAQKPKEQIKKQEPAPKNTLKPKNTNAKKKVPEKKKDLDLNSLLKTLEKASEGKEEKSRKEARSEKTDAKTDSQGPYNDANPISISEHQAIKQQIESNWNIPIAAKNSDQITITLNISLKPSGEVMNVKLVEKQCANADSITCQAVIDSLFRAVAQASPFESLSPSRYNAWKEFNIECQPPSI